MNLSNTHANVSALCSRQIILNVPKHFGLKRSPIFKYVRKQGLFSSCALIVELLAKVPVLSPSGY